MKANGGMQLIILIHKKESWLTLFWDAFIYFSHHHVRSLTSDLSHTESRSRSIISSDIGCTFKISLLSALIQKQFAPFSACTYFIHEILFVSAGGGDATRSAWHLTSLGRSDACDSHRKQVSWGERSRDLALFTSHFSYLSLHWRPLCDNIRHTVADVKIDARVASNFTRRVQRPPRVKFKVCTYMSCIILAHKDEPMCFLNCAFPTTSKSRGLSIWWK